MEDILEITLLFDFYGSLLTDKQRDIFDMYYNLDYSLQEIAESVNISRQTVFDTIKRSKANLYSFEEKLGLVQRHIKIKEDISSSIDNISNVLDCLSTSSPEYTKLLQTKEILQKID